MESIKKSFPQVEVMTVGTNSAASESMMRAGAEQVATGENPVIVASRTAQIIVGPMGIALADALMGEMSPAMANAVGLPGADPHESLRHLCGRRQPEIFCHHG